MPFSFCKTNMFEAINCPLSSALAMTHNFGRKYVLLFFICTQQIHCPPSSVLLWSWNPTLMGCITQVILLGFASGRHEKEIRGGRNRSSALLPPCSILAALPGAVTTLLPRRVPPLDRLTQESSNIISSLCLSKPRGENCFPTLGTTILLDSLS